MKKTKFPAFLPLLTATFLCLASSAGAAPVTGPWMDPALTAQVRSELLLKEMTLDEKLLLVFGYSSSDQLTQIDPKVIPGINTKELVAKVIPGSAGAAAACPAAYDGSAVATVTMVAAASVAATASAMASGRRFNSEFIAVSLYYWRACQTSKINGQCTCRHI